MDKGLEALEKINHTICLAFDENNNALFNKDQYEHIDCKDIYEFIECYNIIRKALKALKVITKKAHIRLGRNGDQYYFQTTNNYYYISKEKYDLLKGVGL